MVQRRTYLKSVGSIAAIGAVGVTNATAFPSQEDLRQRLRKAFLKNGSKGVKQEAEQLGVTYDQAVTQPKSTGDVSTDNNYDESEAELSVLTLSKPDPDQVAVFSQMSYGAVESSFRSSAYVDDVIGFGFNNDHWSVVGEPTTFALDENEAEFYSGSVESGGVVAAIDIKIVNPRGPPENSYAEVSGTVENLDGVAGTIWGHHEHTFALTSDGVIDSVTAGASAFEVTLSDGTTAWEAAKPSDPEDALD